MAQPRRKSFSIFFSRKVEPIQQANTDEQINQKVVENMNDLLLKEGCSLAEKDTPDDYKNAIKKFSEIKCPTVDMLYLRGNAHLKLGGLQHNQKAIDDFTKGIRLSNNQDPSSRHLIAELYYKRAFAHQMLRENDHAIHDYSLYIRHANNRGPHALAKGFLSRGLVYESKQLMQKAIEDINQAIKLTHGQNPYYIYCRERVYIAMSERNDEVDDEDEDIVHSARENEDNDKKDGDENIENSEKWMNSEVSCETPNDRYEKVFYDALLGSEQGKYDRALVKFEKAFECATNKYQRADSLFRQGLCQYELGQKTAAQNMFIQALGYNPKHARAIFRLGMMQAANNQLKDALKTLSSAYKYAPNHIDILNERANIYEKLGKVDEAMYDRRRAMQLAQSPSNMIVILEDRMRHLKAEILHEGESAIRHFKIGWLQEALHKFRKTVTWFHEENGKTIEITKEDNSTYKEAVNEYKAAIHTDAEHICPEAHALLALCQDEEKDILPAHDAFQKLFKMFETYPEFIEMWKLFTTNIQHKNYWIEMGTPPTEKVLIKIYEVERNREAIDDDEKSFNEKENLLSFYRTCRVQLSNVLAAFALAGCNKEVIAHNLKGTYSKAAFVLKLISKGISNVPQVGSILEAATGKAGEFLEDKDHELIKNKLEMISNCGDIIEQNEIARRVARRLADRYKEQLLRLHKRNEEIQTGCCSFCKKILPFIEPFDDRPPAKRVASFAVNYIISAIADESIKTLRLTKANDQDSLVELLVELACRARGPKITVPKCYHDDPNQYLPLTPTLNNDPDIQQQQIPVTENQDTKNSHNNSKSQLPPSITDRFHLYEFFRAPGLLYDPNEDLKVRTNHQQQQTSLTPVNEEEVTNHNDNDENQSNQNLTSNITQNITQNQDPINGEKWSGFKYMNPDRYGYRLCSSIEFKILKEEHQKMMQRCVCCTKCCC